MRRRARTVEAPRQDLDMMVLEYSCRDASAFTAMGKYCKEVKWRVAAMGTEPVEVGLHVEKLPQMSSEVTISANGNKLFPLGAKAKEKLKADFEQKWPFRGVAKGINKKNFFEVKPKAMGEEWFPAISVSQKRDGGLMEALIWLPDGAGGAKKVFLPAVEKADIREQATKKPLTIPERYLKLMVPSEDPLRQSTLTLLDTREEEHITHFFARATPPPGGVALETLPAENSLFMECSKDRMQVTSQVTHTTLVDFLSAEGRQISCSPESKTKMTWKFQLGPMAQHTVTVEKKSKTSKIVTLTVDGKLLVESAAKDFDCDWDDDHDDEAEEKEHGPWACKFRFLGERSLKFKVFETDTEGDPLESTDLVEALSPEQIKYQKVCVVSLTDSRDLTSALLEIDGVEFNQMKEAVSISEENIACDPEVLQMQYGITVPTKVRDEPPTGLKALQVKLREAGEQAKEAGEKIKEHWEKKGQPGLQEFGNKVGETVGKMFQQGNQQ